MRRDMRNHLESILLRGGGGGVASHRCTRLRCDGTPVPAALCESQADSAGAGFFLAAGDFSCAQREILLI